MTCFESERMSSLFGLFDKEDQQASPLRMATGGRHTAQGPFMGLKLNLLGSSDEAGEQAAAPSSREEQGDLIVLNTLTFRS